MKQILEGEGSSVSSDPRLPPKCGEMGFENATDKRWGMAGKFHSRRAGSCLGIGAAGNAFTPLACERVQ